ncbi:MAG: outer membrane protein assembly factor BamD [Candidatus Eisenbacteria bacterium]|uniref:Outer membrane protein assembly factor BamD n=1 Tax=Eiseniibacteriota bacterium TaxID=2212470 RepID=A0A7Y2EDI9_UNCEI|nr:outer membrane protein assembly factor BamD [Candidatus Eisenbacteria bacterium]
MGSTWSKSAPDSLRIAGDQFARLSLHGAASFEHERAQTSNLESSWTETLRLYEDMLQTWPTDKHAPRTSLYAGEAALNLKQFETAMKHYGTAAASDTASFAEEANWRQVTTADSWHEHLADANSDSKADGQKVAKELRELARTFAAKYPNSKNGFDGIWRGAELALHYRQHQEAADDFSRLASQYPNHEKAPLAAALAGDVLFEAKDYAAAAQGYERALGLLEQAGQDSLRVRVVARVPLSYYRHAEQVRDKDGLGKAAPAFEQLATRFPDYEHAPQAMYQSGLGYFESKQLGSGFRVMNDFLVRYPEHELARDTHLQIASAHENAGSKLEAAQAYRRYALAYPSEADAVESYLHAMTLLEEAEEKGTLDHFRREFLSAFPEEDDVVMEILHGFAKRELTQVSRENPVSKRLEVKRSDLAAYIEKSQSSSDLADPDLLGEIAFLQGEEILAPYLEVYLRLPLNESIEKKKTQLEQVIAAYQRCAEQGSEAWSNAASFRTGYALIHFGDRLEQSERPNLGAEDLTAYEEVIGEEAWTFFDKGEGIWEELLRTRAEASEDPGSWLEKTRKFLWPRLAERFFFRPEMEYPRVEPKEPKVRDMAVSSEALPDEGSSKE